jgi:predicted nucleotidyltransferase
MTTEPSNSVDNESEPRFHHSMERNCTILEAMRIDSKGTLFGYPLLYVRKLVRVLNNYLSWDLKTVQEVLSVRPTKARKIVNALHAAGLSKRCRGKHLKTWTTTQAAQTLASATAAKPITRQTADRVLAGLLARVDRVNSDDRFLAKVTRVIVFGSYLRAGVDRLSDVDIAVELAPKESRRNEFRELNYRRVAQAERKGHRFSGILDRELWWRSETLSFLKDRSRSISLVDYKREKKFVDKVPRRTLLCTAKAQPEPPKKLLKHIRLSRRPKGCPF